MCYLYRDYENELATDLVQFSEIITLQMDSKEFNGLSPEQKTDRIWKIFESFSREYRVPDWANCLQSRLVKHTCKWQGDISDIFSGESCKDILVVFENFVHSHKLPKLANCFGRINNQFLHDGYLRCKRCGNHTTTKKIR